VKFIGMAFLGRAVTFSLVDERMPTDATGRKKARNRYANRWLLRTIPSVGNCPDLYAAIDDRGDGRY
jgi:hypothetical protein